MSDNSYDEVPYIGYPFAQTHPDRLGTIATLLGMHPALVERCRVLEIGCGDGANLLPMASRLPHSQFLGFDLAGQPIAQGNAHAAALNLTNIEFRQADVLEAGAELGQFDYIIAHGVYSWVPAAVQEGILALCREHLTEHGVAYISYNTYPGCHLRQMAREMMLFHVRDMQEPQERVEQGLTLLKFLLQRFPSPEAARADLYGAILSDQVEDMDGWRRRETIYHDDLAPINTPFYFHQFAAQASQHGLQYLSEANFYETRYHHFPPPVRDLLQQFGPEHEILREQYLDFIKCRSFRQTLLCHNEIQLNRTIDPQLIGGFHLSAVTQLTSIAPDLRPGVTADFTGTRGAKLQTDFPLAKAALLKLSEAGPYGLPCQELLSAARQHLELTAQQQEFDAGDWDAEQAQVLHEILFAAYCSGLIELHRQVPLLPPTLTARPQADKFVRWQAEQELPLTNLFHKTSQLEDPLSQKLLQLSDGTRTHTDLLAALTDFAAKQGLTAGANSITAPAEIRTLLAQGLEQNLQKLWTMGLLSA